MMFSVYVFMVILENGNEILEESFEITGHVFHGISKMSLEFSTGFI